MKTKSRKWAVYVGVALIVVLLAGMLLCVETVTESDKTRGTVQRNWRICSRFSATPEAPWWDEHLNNPSHSNEFASTRHRVVKRYHAFGLFVEQHEIGVFLVGKPRPPQ